MIGSYLVTEEIINDNSGIVYTGGDIISCFFGVIYGMAYIGMTTPNFKALTEGRVAGKMAYDIIQR
jgi:hypothetical protein